MYLNCGFCKTFISCAFEFGKGGKSSRNVRGTNLLIGRIIVKCIVEPFQHTQFVALLVLPYAHEAVDKSQESGYDRRDYYDYKPESVFRRVFGPKYLWAYNVACEA